MQENIRGISRNIAWLTIRKKIKVETVDICIKIWKQCGGLFWCSMEEKTEPAKSDRII